jgi:hypothetical protein
VDVRNFNIQEFFHRNVELMKFSLIDLEAEMPTRRNQDMDRERLSERTPRTGDAIVRSYENLNRKNLAEMTRSESEFKNLALSNNKDVQEVLAHYLPQQETGALSTGMWN